MDILVIYTNSKKEHLHTWETSLPINNEDIMEAVYSTGLVEDDDVSFSIELDNGEN